MKVSELFRAEPTLKVLIYGDSGTGKTTWAGQAPRPLVLLTEKQGLPALHIANPDAEVALVDNWAQIEATVSRLKMAHTTYDHEGQQTLTVRGSNGEPVVIQTLVIDSLTHVSELCRQHHTASDQDKTTLQEWGFVKRSVARLLGAVRDLSCNVICVALASDVGGDGGEMRRTLPLMYPSSLRFEIAQYFSAVALAMKRADRFGLAWQLGERWITKRPPTRQPFPGVTPTEIGTGVGTLGSILRALYPDVDGVAYGELDDATKITRQGDNE